MVSLEHSLLFRGAVLSVTSASGAGSCGALALCAPGVISFPTPRPPPGLRTWRVGGSWALRGPAAGGRRRAGRAAGLTCLGGIGAAALYSSGGPGAAPRSVPASPARRRWRRGARTDARTDSRADRPTSEERGVPRAAGASGAPGAGAVGPADVAGAGRTGARPLVGVPPRSSPAGAPSPAVAAGGGRYVSHCAWPRRRSGAQKLSQVRGAPPAGPPPPRAHRAAGPQRGGGGARPGPGW
jgi:hypothetical protein